MVELVRYEAARRALAAAVRVDEVKHIRDSAMAMKLYARLAGDDRMMRDATAIRERAERRLGEMMQEQMKIGGKAKATQSAKGFKKNPLGPPTLAEAGISKSLAARARKLAAIPEAEFEKRMEELRNPPPATKPSRRRKRAPKPAIEVEVVTPADTNYRSFLHNAEWAAELANEHEYPDLIVDAAILQAVRKTAAAWARCAQQLEARHGKKEGNE